MPLKENGSFITGCHFYWRIRMTYQIVSERRKNHQSAIKTPNDVYNLIKRYGNSPKEQFLVITLNGANVPISVCIATIGLANKTIVHPREVFVRAIQDMATAVVICHNHPSGSLSPSREDEEITMRMRKAGEVTGIQVIDHIIFSKNGFISLRKEGCFDRRGNNEPDKKIL
jgi:DNA repair protein RadC